MTVLASKNQRDSLGINCIERGIVYSMLLLRYSAKNLPNTLESPNVYKDSVKSTFTVRRVNDSQLAFIDSEVRLPYAPLASLRNAWAVARNLTPITNDDPNPFETTSPPYSNSLAPHAPIPTDPAWVTTLERYFGWLSCLLAANTFPDLTYCQIQILEDAPAYSTFFVKLSLPFRYQNYLLSGNLIDSLIAVVRDLDAEPDTEPIDLSIPSLVSARQLLFRGTGEERITIVPNFTANSLIATYPNGESRELGGVSSGGLSGSGIVALLEGLTGNARLNANAVRDIPLLNGSEIVALLSALTGNNRLDATAIKNLPTGASLTGLQIAALLEALTETDRLNASAIEGWEGTAIVSLLSALTGNNRLDASAIKNLPTSGASLTGLEIAALLEGLTGTDRLNAAAIEGLPSGGATLTASQIVALLEGLTGSDRLNASAIEGWEGSAIVTLLSALTGNNRLDAGAIKNLPTSGNSAHNSLYDGLVYHFPFDNFSYSVAQSASFNNTIVANNYNNSPKLGTRCLINTGAGYTLDNIFWRTGNFNRDFTVSFWFYPTIPSGGGAASPFAIDFLNGQGNPFWMFIISFFSRSGGATTPRLIARGNIDLQLPDNRVALDTWHFVAARYSALERNFVLTINNSNYNVSGNVSSNLADENNTSASRIYLFGGSTGISDNLNNADKIDQLLWYYRRLSDNEIVNLYNSGNGIEL